MLQDRTSSIFFNNFFNTRWGQIGVKNFDRGEAKKFNKAKKRPRIKRFGGTILVAEAGFEPTTFGL